MHILNIEKYRSNFLLIFDYFCKKSTFFEHKMDVLRILLGNNVFFLLKFWVMGKKALYLRQLFSQTITLSSKDVCFYRQFTNL